MKMLDDIHIKKGPIAWMANNSVTANLLMLILLVGGLMCGTRIKQELFPDFDMDMVTISVPYPGASPEEVEQGIVLAIEEGVQGLDDVKEVTASAMEGLGVVSVEMMTGGDLQKLSNDIQREVDRITTLPDEAEEPQVIIITHKNQVLSLVLYGDHDERVLRETAEQIRDSLIQDNRITQVELSGVRNLEISVEIPQEKLRTYNLTLEDIAAKLRRASVELPGGGLKTRSGEVLVRMKERRDYGVEFARIPIITRNDGTEVLLEDIGTVIDGFEDTDKYATYNGKRAVMLDVYRVGKQTPISVSDAVTEYVDRYNQTLPPGLHVEKLNDSSEYYRQRIGLLLRNGYLGLALVLILLGFFLEARLAFWVTMGIPISFLGSLLFLPLFGASINMVSLFAFIVALGIVVDDAIVVGENIYKKHQLGMPFAQAAVVGAREMAIPVVFSVLTNIAAFMPLFFVPGVMGKFFKIIPTVVVTVFAISLVECLFVLPAHLAHQKDRQRRGLSAWLHNNQQVFSRWFARMVEEVYGPFLDKSIKRRYNTVAIGAVILILALAYVKSGRMGMVNFPKVESDFAIVTAVMPYGTAVEKTESVQKKLIAAAQQIISENGGEKLVKGIYAQIGSSVQLDSFQSASSGAHITSIMIYLTDTEVRPISTGEFVSLWRQKTGGIAGLESIKFEADAGGPGRGPALTVELSHRDLKVLEAASAELAEALGYFPNVKDIDDGFSPGKQQLDFKIRPEGRSLGLTASEVAKQVRNSFYGAEALRQQRGRNEIKVMVRLPESQRISEYNIEELILRTPTGAEVPLTEAVDIDRGRAYTSIDRRNGRRVVTVTSDVIPYRKSTQILGAIKVDALIRLVEKYPGLRFGFEGQQAEMRESIVSLIWGLLGAMLVVYAMLAIPFKSYSQPLIVMISIPFGIVGAIIGHMIMGYSLSILSMFGIVALSGVVINDSLILIDFANRRHNSGLGIYDAIHSAGVHRFRPIMLTTLTTFFGLMPMILERSLQARFLIPMAISLGFGILFSTMITLLLVPSLYVIIHDIENLFRAPHKDMPVSAH